MSKRSNVDALLDSVTAINDALAKVEPKPEEIRGTLRANVGHINLCLGKEEYTKVLTAEQTATLDTAVAAAEAKLATLPKEEKKQD
jgi:hypothetical protein